MPNNTVNDYKEAVRIKFEKEKNGPFSNYFNPASQANLRDLCWKILTSEPSSDDLNVYYDFFKSKFDPAAEDISITYTDKFKKVGDFLKRKSEPAKIDTINLAAILVNFELRPYQKFFKYADKENFTYDNGFSKSDTKQDSQNIDEEVKQEQKNENGQILTDTAKTTNSSDVKTKSLVNLPKTLKYIGFTTVSTFCLIALYFMFFYKPCMQWSGDHFEKVSCDLEVNGIGNFNVVEPFDKTIFDLKKINVCDTTSCFDKNGEAVVWYAKTANGIDFFNGHGRHPETNSPLRPVTRYILNKYVKK